MSWLSAGITFQTNGSPGSGPFSIFCDATIPGRTTNVTVDIAGPASLGVTVRQPDTSGVFRGKIDFNNIRSSDSGVYNCSVMVGGVTEGSITAVLDASGKFKD